MSRTDDPPFPTDEQYRPRNVMGVWNPDTWDPDADDRPEAGSVNLDVSGTVGPDYLGQQTVDVDGHQYDRDPDMSEDHARRLALRGEFDDLEDGAPLPLLSSDMRADPIEGVQGSYSKVIRLPDPCPACGFEYGVHYCASTLGGVHGERCLACEHELVKP